MNADTPEPWQYISDPGLRDIARTLGELRQRAERAEAELTTLRARVEHAEIHAAELESEMEAATFRADRAESALAAVREQNQYLIGLLAEATADDAIQSDEAWHSTCRWCWVTWGTRYNRDHLPDVLEYYIPEHHDADCWVLRARAALRGDGEATDEH